MIEARQYTMLYDAQRLRDSLNHTFQDRILVLENAQRTDADHRNLLERKTTGQEADLVKLRAQLSGQKAKLLTTLGVVVGAATTYILVGKR